MIIPLETLGSFITTYLNTHDISINELGKKTKIAHSTLDHWIAGDYKRSPTLDALQRLANFTGVELCYIVELIYPQPPRRINPSISRLAEQIAQLPPEAMELMDTIILGLAVKNRGGDPNIR